MTKHKTGTREEWSQHGPAAQGGEGAGRQRRGAAAAGAAAGPNRQGVSIRD